MVWVVPSPLIDPSTTTPPRPVESVRRTSHIDMVLGDTDLRLTGAARDLHTGARAVTVMGEATVSADLDGPRRLQRLVTEPRDARSDQLLGLVVGRGFRAALDEALPDERARSTPLYLLLDDLPVAALISGYAGLYRPQSRSAPAETRALKADICSGWRSDGTMMVALREQGAMPVPVGPEAIELEPADDQWAWHTIDPLPAGAMRRRRLVEVSAGDPFRVFAMFRDTHVDADGRETVLHEYSLTATLDPESFVLHDCVARPRVLPWELCPEAAASAHRLDGHDVRSVRTLVRDEFRGTTTCTHLNDLLRSLGDVAAFVPRLSA